VPWSVCASVHLRICACVLACGGRLGRTNPSSLECTLHRQGASPAHLQTIFAPVVERYSSQKHASLCSHAGASMPTHCSSARERQGKRKGTRGAIEVLTQHMWICVLTHTGKGADRYTRATGWGATLQLGMPPNPLQRRGDGTRASGAVRGRDRLGATAPHRDRACRATVHRRTGTRMF
jgi:hypothetical protein